ncbi:hypothetical protein Avbf_12443 [Armadillidium vulgare]|nr:hypothetical protein Avbf_12443 [Armadillidium vulgare]
MKLLIIGSFSLKPEFSKFLFNFFGLHTHIFDGIEFQQFTSQLKSFLELAVFHKGKFQRTGHLQKHYLIVYNLLKLDFLYDMKLQVAKFDVFKGKSKPYKLFGGSTGASV